MSGGPADLLRRPDEAQQATFLELFFDLVFVLTLTQLSRTLTQHLTWSGAGQGLLLLLALWWVWTNTAWTTDLYDPLHPAIQLLVIATMLGTFLMAAVLPEAFGKRSMVFAGLYVAINVGRHLYFLFALRAHPLRRRTLRLLVWFGLSALPWLTGALAPGAARAALWTVALGIDYLAGAARYPVPGMGRAPAREWPIVAEHLAERYRQMFIIALGELVLVAGLTLNRSGLTLDRTAAAVISFATTALFWRIYIHRAGELLPAVIGMGADPDRLARWALFAHLPMVAGVVVTAVGVESVVAHPLGHTGPAWVTVVYGGPCLFLAGLIFLGHEVLGRVPRDRLVGLLLMAALAPVALLLPPLPAALAAAAVLAGTALADARSVERPETRH
ncbi:MULTISPECIES: low temperature requirement protein A [Micromonospora]|uniref:Low temperature requirement protein A n=1 Tax=Micromonospora solifontis TaxID=2487138 RepID=A0ABX9WK02_9ACTN|nr:MULTISPECIES: low temperature requirement protein A [Micromonospora]NES13776.1 low temperature requirement protein A [Micromonospora sp. PPF5-17B]NES35567.1 low temperature requirement protein A [Micromonospora solifontis]NES55947.1 low temperature requirement protein A [Micromonospora sp. PPF5-6]RNM00621.1 low temperature requirement protein A [Micromonospora solifontis]